MADRTPLQAAKAYLEEAESMKPSVDTLLNQPDNYRAVVSGLHEAAQAAALVSIAETLRQINTALRNSSS